MIEKDAHIEVSAKDDGTIHTEVHGSLENVSFLWALIGGSICRNYNVSVEAMSLSFLTLGERFAEQKPVEHTGINWSAVERAKEAADHAED